jgi:hypothetical protein
MRVSDAQEIVESAHIDPTLYSFDGEAHEPLCCLELGQGRRVLASMADRHKCGIPPQGSFDSRLGSGFRFLWQGRGRDVSLQVLHSCRFLGVKVT